MTEGDKFTPRLGRIGNRGGGARKAGTKLKGAAKRLGKRGRRAGVSGKHIARGKAASFSATARVRGMARVRMRRVVVKVHIARAGKGTGTRAFGRHLDYVERDGVERDGTGGELYTRDGETADGRAFASRSEDDRHQFRVMVSAEDADQMDDLKSVTRSLMREAERDLGTRLDWVAVDHHNTGHSHTHILIRGRDYLDRDLVIAPDYLMKGLRGRASQIVTEALGPRRDHDIARAAQAEISQDRFTGIDRELAGLAQGDVVAIDPARGAAERFQRSLRQQRLKHLEGLGLAAKQGPGEWQLKPGWDRALKAMGRRGDIVRALAAGIGSGAHLSDVRFFEERMPGDAPVTGRVLSQGPDDELRGTRFLLIEDLHGTPWHVAAASLEPGTLPPSGAIVEVSVAAPAAKRADHVIADVAEQSGGVYSDALHRAFDPASTAAYRLAHVRRLEALRRAGIVLRNADGVWQVGADYLGRAEAFEARGQGGVRLRVPSWMTLEAQTTARAATWLDTLRPVEGEVLAPEFDAARRTRLIFLRSKGLLDAPSDVLPEAAMARLRNEELKRAGSNETARSGRAQVNLAQGEMFDGTFERTVDLAQGRMAIIGSQREFALVPWRDELQRHRGQDLVIELRAKGLSWTFQGGRTRGPSL